MKKLLSLTLTILVLCGISSNAFAACRPHTAAPNFTYGCQAQQYIFGNGCWQMQPLPDCNNSNNGSNSNDWLTDSDEFWQNILAQINGSCTPNDPPNNNTPDDNANNGSDQDNNADRPGNTPDQPETNHPDNAPGTEQKPNTPNDYPGSDQEQIVNQNERYIQQVLYLVNQERSANGLQAVALDNTLSAAAQLRAQECAASFSHTRPDGSSCFTALREMGINYKGAAENIAYGQSTPQEVVNAWMKSDGHRKNILNSKYTDIGIGYAVINGTPYWSQFFTY